MNKSTITRERIQRIIRAIDSEAYDEEEIREWLSSDEIMELTRIALASLEAEAVAYMIGGHYLMHAQDPKVDNYTSAVPLYTAPPMPVSVPDDVMAAIQKVARIRLDLNEFDGDKRGIAESLGEAEEALIEVVNRRAAMLQAEPVTTANKLGGSPAQSPIDHGYRKGCECSGCKTTVRICAELAGWIPVSERMPENDVDVQIYCPDSKEQMVGYLERNEQEGYFRYATWRTGDGIYCQPTHWMPLPAAPQEVKGD